VLESIAGPRVVLLVGGRGLEADAHRLNRVDRCPNLTSGFCDDSRFDQFK
jgi:hypothetical protein